MQDIAISTFHMGFLLTSAFCCASIHLMIVVGEPDLTEEKDKAAWRGYIRFLQFMMFLPLIGYFLTHFQEEPQAPLWFLGTVVITGLLFVPTAWALKASKELPEKNPQAQDLQRKVQTQLRMLLGNFMLGLVMGAAMILPIMVMDGSVVILFKLGVFSSHTRDLLFKFTPVFCIFTIPYLMPMMFLMFGPLVLKITQGARDLRDDSFWSHRWQELINKSQALGFNTLSSTRLFELPWQDLGTKNAFYLGWPSLLNPIHNGIFIIKGMETVLTTDELDFVVAHEASHGLLRHPVRRVVLGVGIFFFFLGSQGVALALHSVALSFGAAAFTLLWGMHLLRRQAEMQEMEADVMAVKLQGATTEAAQTAANALRKLDEFNNAKASRGLFKTKNLTITHPRTDLRVAYLQAIFAAPVGEQQNAETSERRAA